MEVEGPPIAQRPYPVSAQKRAIIKEHISEMLKLEIIVPSNSEWASPITMHTRDNGKSWRFTCDYRKLNQRTKSDPFPFNRVDLLIHRLGEAAFLSVIDLKKGYWQVNMHPDSEQYTSFICDEGKFSFKRISFGLKTAASVFQRLVNKVLGKARGIFAEAYLDDIIIYSKSWSEHIEHIRYVLEQLKKAGLTVNPVKCQFGKTEIKYLGFIVSPEGVRVDRDKIAPILDYPAPKTVKQVRRFLGMCGWYRHYIEHYADIALPLNNLIGKNKSFIWTTEQARAFDKLKNLIANSVTLAFPNLKEKFIVRTDASDYGVSGVLAQKIQGLERPIAFASRSLSKTEQVYHASERECVGILFALKKFELYLDGQEFILETDNSALTWLHSMRDVNSKFVRWALRIQDFQPTISHCPGRLNVVADALSRAPTGKSEDVDENKEGMYPPIQCSPPSILCSLTSSITLDMLKSEQQQDKETQALLLNMPEGFVVQEGILYKYGKHGGRIPFITKSLRSAVLEYFHDRPESGHLGVRKTVQRLIRRVFWFGMQEDIYTYILSCPTCQKCKNPSTKPSGQMASVKSSGPWDLLAMDLMGPLPRTRRGNTQLLVVVDHFSKWVELFPIRKATATAVANKLEQEIFCRWGAPSALLSDNGTQFTSKIVKKVCQNWGIKQKFTTFYHPQANITERINRNIVAIIRTYVERKHAKWDEFLPEVGLALRTAVSDTTGYSPCMLNLGREISTLFDRSLEDEDDYEFQSRIEHKNSLIENLESVYAKARLSIEKAQSQQKLNYDRRHKNVTFQVGELVCLRTHHKSNKSRKIMKKLSHRWTGPYVVTKIISPLTYEIAEKESDKVVGTHNIKNLKKYFDRPEPLVDNSSVRQNSSSGLHSDSNVLLHKNEEKNSYNLRSRRSTGI